MPVLLQHVGHQPRMPCRVPSSSSPTLTWKQKRATLGQDYHNRWQMVPSSSWGPRIRYQHVTAQATVAAAAALPAVAASVADASGTGVPGLDFKWWIHPLRCWKEWWDLKNHTADKPRPPARKLSAIAAKLWAVLRVNKLLLALAILTMLLAAASELAIPHFTSATIFAVAKQGNAEGFHWNVRLLAVLSVSYGIFSGFRGFAFSLLNSDLIQNLRAELFRAIIRQEVAFFDEAEVGVLTSRLGSDCQAVVRCVATNINVALRNTLQCIGGAVYLWYLSQKLALACGGVTVLLWAIALRYGAFTRKAQRSYQDALASTNEVAQEVFGLSRVVRTFGTEDREVGRYRRCLQALRNINVRQACAYLMYLIAASSLFNLTKVLSLLIGGGMALKGVITAQQLTTFVLYVEFVTYASLNVCDQWGAIMESIGASERVMEFLDKPPAAQLAPGRVLPHFSGSVTFRDVKYAYASRPKSLALQGVDLTIRPGQLLALVGLSGSGKSTLVSLLQRHYDPTEGAILLDGDTDLREADAGWYRDQLGVVSQDPRLFSESIRENIAYGKDGLTQEEIEEAARLANAHAFIMALPRGYSTMVTDKLLSGGQRQRIAMARALVRKPKILVLDEFTSALDAESEAAVQEALDKAMHTSNCALLVIAHRLSTVRNADNIVVMAAGRVSEQGTHAQLMMKRGIYYGLVRRQAGGDGSLGTEGEPPQRATLSGDEEEAANGALTWFGHAESHKAHNGGVTKTATVSVDESFDEDRLPDHSKDAHLSTAEVS